MKGQILDFETILKRANVIGQSISGESCCEEDSCEQDSPPDCYDCDFNCEECDSER